MKSRKLDTGETIAWEKSPFGDGLIIYAEGGPGGMVQICDFQMVPPRLVAAAMSIQMNQPAPAGPSPEYKPPFEPHGWR